MQEIMTMTGSCLLLMGCKFHRLRKKENAGTRPMSAQGVILCLHLCQLGSRMHITLPASKALLAVLVVEFVNVNVPARLLYGDVPLTALKRPSSVKVLAVSRDPVGLRDDGSTKKYMSEPIARPKPCSQSQNN